MAGMTRRSLLNSSIGLAATATLARPYVANAQAKTATVWWVQGFAHEEDVAFKSPPIPPPNRRASDSVARPIYAASGTIAIPDAIKMAISRSGATNCSPAATGALAVKMTVQYRRRNFMRDGQRVAGEDRCSAERA